MMILIYSWKVEAFAFATVFVSALAPTRGDTKLANRLVSDRVEMRH